MKQFITIALMGLAATAFGQALSFSMKHGACDEYFVTNIGVIKGDIVDYNREGILTFKIVKHEPGVMLVVENLKVNKTYIGLPSNDFRISNSNIHEYEVEWSEGMFMYLVITDQTPSQLDKTFRENVAGEIENNVSASLVNDRLASLYWETRFEHSGDLIEFGLFNYYNARALGLNPKLDLNDCGCAQEWLRRYTENPTTYKYTVYEEYMVSCLGH